SKEAVVRHHLSARALGADGDRVAGVVTDGGKIAADEVVVAAGPWSPCLLEPLGIRLPVLGVRGWLVRVDPGEPVVRHLVRTAERNGPVGAARVGDIARSGLPTSDGYGSIVHPYDDGMALVGSSRGAWLPPAPQRPSAPRR